MVQTSCQSFGFLWKKVHASVPLKLKILLTYTPQDDDGKSQRKSSSDII